jgi:hypothetical protein
MSTPEPPPYPGGDDPQQLNPPGFPPPPPPAPGVPPQYGMPPQAIPGNSKATTSLVLGIIGLFCCGIVLGPIAIVTGKQATAEAALAGFPQPGNAKAGIILGWVAIGLMGVGLLFFLLAFALGMAGMPASTTG